MFVSSLNLNNHTTIVKTVITLLHSQYTIYHVLLLKVHYQQFIRKKEEANCVTKCLDMSIYDAFYDD